jgi:hypothetical protein
LTSSLAILFAGAFVQLIKVYKEGCPIRPIINCVV